MGERRKILIWALVSGAILTAFTAYVLLDAFVIERAFSSARDTSSAPDAACAESSANAYADVEDAVIALSTYRVHETTVYVADVKAGNAAQLRTALARDTYGRNITEKTSVTAQDHGALLAVNGDYYGSRRAGYVIRNGTVYRETVASADQEDLCVFADGNMSIIREGDISARALADQGAVQVFSFGPALVEDGEIAVRENDEVGQAMVSNPRTAIAMIEPLHYLLIVADGRTDESAGLSLYELAAFCQELGASVAYNLDGGGSSTMVLNGEIVNHPTTNGRRTSERAVSDIVYIR